MLNTRDVTTVFRVGVAGVVDFADKFCIDCFIGELRMNSSKSSSISSTLCDCGNIVDEPVKVCE